MSPPRRKPSEKSKSAELKLKLIRDFAGPRALVYAAWTEPAHLKQWSAPHGFTLPVSEGELKVGGAWRAVMISPEGEKMALRGVYREIVPHELLVFTHAWDGEGAPETLVTIRFEDAPGGGTRLTFEQTGFDSAGSRDGHRGGWEECFERLDTLLETLSKPARKPVRAKAVKTKKTRRA